MAEWLQRIFLGHAHKWKKTASGTLSEKRGKDGEWIVVGHRYVLECEICGTIKHYDAI